MRIWQIVEYSLAVSIVALLLLGMKRLFHDKLDARWHYLIWIVLGVRMVVPVSLEWLKSPLSLFEAIPVNYWTKLLELKVRRAGMEDVLSKVLWVYLAGVLLFAGYYLVATLIVRIRILKMEPAGQELCSETAEIAAKYGLKSCRRIRVGERAMPCVCGLIRPILVLPKEGVAEEVIVHELLHKKYGDVLIIYGLHLIRIVNWFNPLIWYVTAVILNDSEALCDQRVLERMTKVRTAEISEVRAAEDTSDRMMGVPEMSGDPQTEKVPEGTVSEEKIYGSLLLDMAVRKNAHSAKIGTTNMANSYRNMHTRIRRIADFRRVPAGVGFAALCITVILSVSSISYCEAAKIVSCGVEDAGDLERVMLRAMTYEAETKEQAVYLYLKAMKEMNPIYLIAVTPEEELPELEAWIWEMFEQDKFVRWMINGKNYIGNTQNAVYYGATEWMNFREACIENPWFIRNGYTMEDGWIYNLQGDGTKGTATVELYVKEDGETSFVDWGLELVYENGWKVRRVSEEVAAKSLWYESPEPMVEAEAEGSDWRIEAIGYNEAKFYSVFDTNSGWLVYQGNLPTVKEYEEAAEYPQSFDMQYKSSYIYAVYQGEESLEGKEINIVFESYTEEEFTEAAGHGESMADLSTEELLMQAVYDGENYSSSNGSGERSIDGAKVVNGEKILLTGGGTGPDSWEEKEVFHFIAWIYYDGECVEVIKQ